MPNEAVHKPPTPGERKRNSGDAIDAPRLKRARWEDERWEEELVGYMQGRNESMGQFIIPMNSIVNFLLHTNIGTEDATQPLRMREIRTIATLTVEWAGGRGCEHLARAMNALKAQEYGTLPRAPCHDVGLRTAVKILESLADTNAECYTARIRARYWMAELWYTVHGKKTRSHQEVSEAYDNIMKLWFRGGANDIELFRTRRKEISRTVRTGGRWFELLKWNGSAAALWPETVDGRNVNVAIMTMRAGTWRVLLKVLDDYQGQWAKKIGDRLGLYVRSKMFRDEGWEGNELGLERVDPDALGNAKNWDGLLEMAFEVKG